MEQFVVKDASRTFLIAPESAFAMPKLLGYYNSQTHIDLCQGSFDILLIGKG